MAAMKWWGWGLASVEFTHEDKPDLGQFIKAVIPLRPRVLTFTLGYKF